MFGWILKPVAPANAGEITITLSADLQSAELQTVRNYSVSVGDSSMETVTLQHTAVYQPENRRWPLASPQAEFWGDWVTNNGEYVTMVYPRRDEVIAQRLAVDLNLLVDDICLKLEDLGCASDLNVYLRLDNDPNSLLDTADSLFLTSIDLWKLLPIEARSDQLSIARASASPHDPQRLTLSARSLSKDDGRNYWFEVELAADLQQVAVIEFLNWTDSNASMELSPDGRYLTVHEQGESVSDTKLHLLNRESGERFTISDNYSGNGLD